MTAWLARPDEPLLEWTRTAIEDAHLQPVGAIDADWEYYRPHEQQRIQYARWQPLSPGLANRRYLVRSAHGWGGDRYRVAVVQAGRIVQTGTPALGRGDIRRLFYGLDLLAERPTQIEIITGRQEPVFTAQSALPGPEERLLLVLGQFVAPPDGKFYPRRWRVPSANVLDVTDALSALGVTFREKIG